MLATQQKYVELPEYAGKSHQTDREPLFPAPFLRFPPKNAGYRREYHLSYVPVANIEDPNTSASSGIQSGPMSIPTLLSDVVRSVPAVNRVAAS